MTTDTTPICGHPACGVPVHGTTLCRDHRAHLLDVVDAVPWLLDELRSSETRQAKVSRSAGAGDRSQVMFNERAARQRTALANAVVQWQAKLADWLGQPVRYVSPIAATYWVTEQLQQQRRTNSWDLAGQMLADLEKHRSRTLLVLNPADEDWFAGRCNNDRGPHTSESCRCACHDGGQCPLGHDCADEWERACPRGLYASSTNGTIVCPLCGKAHDVAARRADLLRQARTFRLTTTEIALAVTTWGDYEVTESMLRARIKTWTARKRIEPVEVDVLGGRRRPTYNLGSVLNLLDADLERREARRRKHATSA